jgi:HSP20 family protein
MTTLSMTRPQAGELGSLLDDFWRIPWAGPSVRRSFPAVNVWVRDEAFFVEAEVPGLKLTDLDLTVTGNELTLSGGREDATGEDVTYHRRERGVGRFGRVIHLPGEVEADSVEASLKDGVLTVKLPRAAALRPRRIEVRSSN